MAGRMQEVFADDSIDGVVVATPAAFHYEVAKEALVKRIEEASAKTGEKVWRMPLWDEYFDYIKSDVAEFKNLGTRAGGAIIGAIFLSKFLEKTPWVHLDIAGPAFIEKERPYIPKGGTGVGVRLLLQLLRDWNHS